MAPWRRPSCMRHGEGHATRQQMLCLTPNRNHPPDREHMLMIRLLRAAYWLDRVHRGTARTFQVRNSSGPPEPPGASAQRVWGRFMSAWKGGDKVPAVGSTATVPPGASWRLDSERWPPGWRDPREDGTPRSRGRISDYLALWNRGGPILTVSDSWNEGAHGTFRAAARPESATVSHSWNGWANPDDIFAFWERGALGAPR